MYLIVNVGSTGTGKSQYIRNLIKQGKRIFIYDVQNEYGNVDVFDPLRPKNQMRYYGEFSRFLDIVDKLPKGYIVAVEEATGVFDSKIGLRFTNMILSKRHSGITYIVNFHLMQYIPPKLVGFMDVLILRKTGDFEKNIEKKFEPYLSDWKKIKASEDVYLKKIYYCSNLTQKK